MIVIEADALFTIGASLASAVLGAFLSWWLTRRHYTRAQTRSLTAEDVEIAKARFAMITRALPYLAIIIIAIGSAIGLILGQVMGGGESP